MPNYVRSHVPGITIGAALAAAHVPLVASLHIAFMSGITFRTGPVVGLILLLMVVAAGSLSRVSFGLKAAIWVLGMLVGYVLLQTFVGSLAIQASYATAGAISLAAFLLITVLKSWLDGERYRPYVNNRRDQ